MGWGFYSLMLTNLRLAEKKAPPPGAFYEKPLYLLVVSVYGAGAWVTGRRKVYILAKKVGVPPTMQSKIGDNP